MTNLTSVLNFGALITLSCCNAVLQIAVAPACGESVGWIASSTTRLSPAVQPGMQGRLRATRVDGSGCDRLQQEGGNRPVESYGNARNGA